MVSILLDKAGIHQDVQSIEPINEAGLTNLMSLVKLQDGNRFILREYNWPHETADELDRVCKEKFLHKLLREHGVPVPEILAEFHGQGKSAVLMEYLQGELLGEVANRLPAKECMQAWRSSGEALRRAHSIGYPSGTHGFIVGEKVQPFEAGSWGHFHLYNVLHHAKRLVKQQQDISIDMKEIEKVLERAVPILNRAPSTLLHNDPHPWNVLVQITQNGWECSGWLDWEYAMVGDATWDVVRMDLFRTKPIGPTPRVFYEGYGAFPSEPNRSIYELSIYLWMYNQ